MRILVTGGGGYIGRYTRISVAPDILEVIPVWNC